MKIASKFVLVLAMLLTAHNALAAELQLYTFLGANPLKGVEVELDGSNVGTTGSQGNLVHELTAGDHRLLLQKRGATLAEYSFSVTEGQNADISVTFATFNEEPEIAIETYAEGEAGAPGVVSGYVTNTGTFAVAGATVSIDELGLSTTTDDVGAFKLEVPRGTYTLKVSHPDYETAVQDGFRVVANVGVEANITLRTADSGPDVAGAVEEVLVVGSYKPATSTVEVERMSTAVTDAISLDDLLRFGDSDVAASLKRIVGISVTGDRYAVVRGLDGRYISATLNGNLMPSTDPFRRDVQLDLFPSEILGGIEIQKNFSADLPGETTGGIIRMTTRGMPDEPVNRLSVTGGYVTGVTGDTIDTYEGSDSDFFGFDDGLRELPGAVRAATNGGRRFSICQIEGQQDCVSQQQAAALAAMLPNIYNPKTTTANPNFGLSYTLGRPFELDSGALGLYGSVSYDQKTSSRQDASIDDLDRASDYSWDVVSTAVNAYLYAGYEANAGWSVSGKTIILRDSEDRTSVESGFDKNEGNNFTEVTLEWVERQFLAQQFEGSVFLFNDHKLEWRAGVSQTSRYSPDRRSYLYLGDSLAISTVERSYADLTEDGLDFGLDYSLPITFSDSIDTNFKFGVLANTRDRDVELVRLGVRQGSNPIDLNQDLESLLTRENFENDAFRLNARSASTDSYTAEQTSTAAYVNSETSFGEALTVVAGVRKDDFSLDLDFPNAPNSPVSQESNEVLPAVAVIYRLGDDWQFRGGYSATVSRPNITELAPSRFYDENGREYIGCPTCVASTIDNFDFRAEYYFGDKDSASLALFYKDISDPMERSVADGSGSATSALTFRNNEAAKVSGIELDASKTLFDGLDHGLSLSGNVALISSEITLDDVGQRLEIDPKRDLQGQSPFLANLQLNYDHYTSGQKATLLLNYFDDRIDVVTRNQPSIMEAGRLLVNINYEKQVGDSGKVKFKAKNLLDAKTEYTQGGRVIESYRKGIEFSLGYSMDF